MLKVISFGEALVDMLSSQLDAEQTDTPESFIKYPGGAPANVAAAIGKLGGDSYMASKVGADMFGRFLHRSLRQAQVNTDYLLYSDSSPTALAFVSLDEHGERSFSFYRHQTADLQFTADEFQAQWFDIPGIFHCCSNTLTEPAISEATLTGIRMAKAAGFLISFDINLRTNLWPDGRDPLPAIWSVLEHADLVKLSREEMDYLCRTESETQVIERLLEAGVSLILLTDGGNPLRYISPSIQGQLTPPPANMVDSTAAGDAFIGGVLFKLAETDCNVDAFTALVQNPEQLESILTFASHCGAHAVSHKGAFTSLPTRADIRV